MIQNQAQKEEPGGRWILFSKKKAQSQKFDKDIMLALNKVLQKAREPVTIWFGKMKYFQLRAILALLTKKADVTELFKTQTNILIWVAKIVN